MRLLGIILVMGSLFYPASGHAQYVHSSTLTAPDAHEGAEFGTALAEVGDIDGDGTSDVLVGAPTDSVEGSNPGRAFLFSGVDGRHLQTFLPPSTEDLTLFGDAMAGVGDVNEDGTPDLAITAEGEAVEDEPSAGRVYIFSGANGHVLHTVASPTPESYGHFGSAVAGIGDVNTDGTPDFLVGARGETVDGSSRAGRLYVISGADASVLDTVESGAADGLGKMISGLASESAEKAPSFVVGANLASAQGHDRAGRAYRLGGTDLSIQQTFASPHPEEGGIFGNSVAGLQDVTDDDTPDVVVGAELETVDGIEKAGRAYLLDGASGDVLHTLTASTPDEDARFGISVVGTEELSARPLVLVGERPAIHERATTENTGPGQVYVFDGEDGQLLQTLSSPNAEERGGFGATLIRLDSQDGTPKVAVGATGESVNGTDGVGRVYVYSPEDN